ncbi:MAG: VTT domain-containing protein [Saprospiraceae bacterium]|nr:VTT domain-containing protein [Saprospiraceae bacterium]
MTEIFQIIIDFISNLNDQEFLAEMVRKYDTLLYVALLLIIFTETGLVVMPLLPGDSLLFTVGALAAATNQLNIWLLMPLMVGAALLGDNVNYFAGRFFGRQVVKRERIFLLKREYIERTQEFYHKYGGKTVIMARFVPIVRTIAPFVAGAGEMHYRKYIIYCVTGAILWVFGITLMGYAFGNIPVVKNNFEIVVLGIIFISVLPMFYHWAKARLARGRR